MQKLNNSSSYSSVYSDKQHTFTTISIKTLA